MTISRNNPRVDEIRQSVRSSYEELQRLIDDTLTTLDATGLYRSPGSNEWTLMETVAHVIEFMPYWADEIARLVAAPGQNFGRTQQHEGRLQAIREHGADTLRQSQAALPESYARLEQVLGTLRDSDLELTGRHSTYGERTLAWFIDEFVTQHIANHVMQMGACLEVVQNME